MLVHILLHTCMQQQQPSCQSHPLLFASCRMSTCLTITCVSLSVLKMFITPLDHGPYDECSREWDSSSRTTYLCAVLYCNVLQCTVVHCVRVCVCVCVCACVCVCMCVCVCGPPLAVECYPSSAVKNPSSKNAVVLRIGWWSLEQVVVSVEWTRCDAERRSQWRNGGN